MPLENTQLPKLIFFDLDGVIIDYAAAMRLWLNRFVEHHNQRPATQWLRSYIPQEQLEFIRDNIDLSIIDRADQDRAWQGLNNQLNLLSKTRPVLAPVLRNLAYDLKKIRKSLNKYVAVEDVKPVLRFFAEKDIPCVIITACGPYHADKKLFETGLTNYFRAAYSTAFQKECREKEHAALEYIEKAGFSPGPDIWLIGDYDFDIESAVKANCRPIVFGGLEDTLKAFKTCKARMEKDHPLANAMEDWQIVPGHKAFLLRLQQINAQQKRQAGK